MISYQQEKEEWYNVYHQSGLEDQYQMILKVFKMPSIDEELIQDDFGTILLEIQQSLITERKYEEVIKLIEIIKQSAPIFYNKEAVYLNGFVVEYYLYKDDLEKCYTYLQPYKDNLESGYDIFINLFKKIQFYQKDELAIELAKSLVRPVTDSDGLTGGAEIELVDTIFYQTIQEYYLAQRNEKGETWEKVEDSLKQYNYDEAFFATVLPEIQRTIKQLVRSKEKPFYTQDTWASQVEEEAVKAARDLFWVFAQYMYHENHFSFSMSSKIWFQFFILLNHKKKDPYTDFSFRFRDLTEVVNQYVSFLSFEKASAFAFVWGLPYIYEFLEKEQLVSLKIKEKMSQHIEKMKKQLINTNKSELWQYDFVHVWNRPISITKENCSEEAKQFQESFTKRLEKIKKRSSSQPFAMNSLEGKSDTQTMTNRNGKRISPHKKKRKKVKKRRKTKRKK